MSETATAGTGRRRRLPPRRLSENRKLVWKGQTIFLTVGYGPDGTKPKELFYSAGYRGGSDMEALVSDLCVLLSVVLQLDGVTAAGFRKSMSETFDLRTGDPMPASILGLLLEEVSCPPQWADAVAQALGTAEVAADETGISGAAEVDPRAAGEAGRLCRTRIARTARHQPEEHGPDGPASAETDE
ncbi:MAG: hypothetical protein F4Y03_18800 [Alphaproteobacteria bacterium]|nr:hypothetical protein [Alphaproteobacteria bacterium]